ncbi:MAG TPA: glycosyltransferase [Gemmatimonadales bacterium]|nr:glycosyltransferase [Gemmatimonadales bacterium]
MRILQAFTPGAAGGLESVVQVLGTGLAARGVDLAVTAVLGQDAPEPPSVVALRAAGVTVLINRLGRRSYRSEWSGHRARVVEYGPDVIHTHGYRADVLGGWAAASRTRRVSTVHGFTGGDWKNRLYERLQIRSYRRYDAVIAVSRSVEARLRRSGLAPSRVVLLPNAWSPTAPPLDRIAARRVLGIAGETRVIGWVGRLSHEKGCDVFLDAAARLGDAALRFSIVGDGAERPALEARARDLGIGDRVSWHGLLPDAGRLMAAFDVFVLSSRTEGTPIALFEAMAAGVPVVATAVGGVPDVVGTGEAWLAAPESPEGLEKAIRDAMDNSRAGTERTARARERLRQHYAVEPWIDRHIELYRRLVDGAGGRG